MKMIYNEDLLQKIAKITCNSCEKSWGCDEGSCVEYGEECYKKCCIAKETAEKIYNIVYEVYNK